MSDSPPYGYCDVIYEGSESWGDAEERVAMT